MTRSPSIARALAAALRSVQLAPADAAGAALARRYAASIDEGDRETLAELGPKLLAALESLRMTPKARQAVIQGGGAPSDPRAAALADLRGRRAAGGARPH